MIANVYTIRGFNDNCDRWLYHSFTKSMTSARAYMVAGALRYTLGELSMFIRLNESTIEWYKTHHKQMWKAHYRVSTGLHLSHSKPLHDCPRLPYRVDSKRRTQSTTGRSRDGIVPVPRPAKVYRTIAPTADYKAHKIPAPIPGTIGYAAPTPNKRKRRKRSPVRLPYLDYFMKYQDKPIEYYASGKGLLKRSNSYPVELDGRVVGYGRNELEATGYRLAAISKERAM